MKNTEPPEHIVTSSEGAAYLGVSSRWVQQLATDGWIKPVARGKWSLPDLIKGYVAFLKDENARRSKISADSRVRYARAAEIERRMAREDRKLIMLDEAMAAYDFATGLYLTSISGLPARMTRNASERRRLEAICDGERQRLADRFAEGASALRTGEAAVDADEEGDAG